jgi:hypothetical protein
VLADDEVHHRIFGADPLTLELRGNDAQEASSFAREGPSAWLYSLPTSLMLTKKDAHTTLPPRRLSCDIVWERKRWPLSDGGLGMSTPVMETQLLPVRASAGMDISVSRLVMICSRGHPQTSGYRQ